MAMNKILLQGRLTKEPEIRLTSKNDKVAHFTIAVDRDFNREHHAKRLMLTAMELCFQLTGELQYLNELHLRLTPKF